MVLLGAGCPECFNGDPAKCKPCRQATTIAVVPEVPVLAVVSDDVFGKSAKEEAWRSRPFFLVSRDVVMDVVLNLYARQLNY